MEKKNKIDDLFSKSLNEFEDTPNPKIWQNIRYELSKKEDKKRVLPFWIKMIGVAAILLIGFSLGEQYATQNILKNSTTAIVLAKKEDVKNKKNQTTKSIIVLEKALVSNSKKGNKKIDGNPKTIANNGDAKSNQIKLRNKLFTTKQKQVQNEKYWVTNTKKTIKNKRQKFNVDNNKEDSESNEENTFFSNQNNMSSQSLSQNKTKIETKQKTDSVLSIKALELQKLETILAEKEANKSKKQKIKNQNWTVFSTLAPVFFESNSGNSNLNSNLDNNTKSFKPELSYGVGLSYNLSNRISIRTSIQNLKSEKRTNDAVYYESATISGFQTEQIVFVNPNNIEAAELQNKDLKNGVLNEKLQYIEVPFELSYKLIDKKTSVNLISGISTLFLQNNSVVLESDQESYDFGKNKNANNINFSGNLGLGLNRKIYKNLAINVDAMIKYQFKTFTTNQNNQYLFGIYTGLNYSF
jgi:hypothetical protein